MKNKYEVNGDITVIYCKSTEDIVETLIDTSDLHLLLARDWTWLARYNRSKKMYVYSNGMSLHRLITNAISGEIVDHKDRNPLNNRRYNLRIVTPSESVRNRDVFKNSTSGYPGVNWSAQYKKWRARIRVEGKEVFLGKFDTLEEAIKARKDGEAEYW